MDQLKNFANAKPLLRMPIMLVSILSFANTAFSQEGVTEVVVIGHSTNTSPVEWLVRDWENEYIRADSARRAAEAAAGQGRDATYRYHMEMNERARVEEQKRLQKAECVGKAEGASSGCQYTAAMAWEGDKKLDCGSLLVDSGAMALEIGIGKVISFSAELSSPSRYAKCVDEANTGYEVEIKRCQMRRDVALETCVRNFGP